MKNFKVIINESFILAKELNELIKKIHFDKQQIDIHNLTQNLLANFYYLETYIVGVSRKSKESQKRIFETITEIESINTSIFQFYSSCSVSQNNEVFKTMIINICNEIQQNINEMKLNFKN